MSEDKKGVSKGFIISIVLVLAISIPIYKELNRDFSKDILRNIKEMDRQRVERTKSGIESLLPLAEKGDVSAQASLARLYHQQSFQRKVENIIDIPAADITVKQNINEKVDDSSKNNAFKWAKLAAEQGDASSQELVAGFYECGRGTAINEERAVFWYSKVADRGSILAKYYLANVLSNGKGVEDKERADKLFKEVYAAMDKCPSCDLPSGGCAG